MHYWQWNNTSSLAWVAAVHLWLIGWGDAYSLSVKGQRHLMSGAWRWHHITPAIRSLHWLLVWQRITFQTVVKCIHGVTPPHLQEFCMTVEKVQGCTGLCQHQINVSTCLRVHTSVGQRSFTFHVPHWNSLPPALHDSHLSLNMFQRRLFVESWMPPGAIVTFLCDSDVGYKCHYLLPYMLTVQLQSINLKGSKPLNCI